MNRDANAAVHRPQCEQQGFGVKTPENKQTPPTAWAGLWCQHRDWLWWRSCGSWLHPVLSGAGSYTLPGSSPNPSLTQPNPGRRCRHALSNFSDKICQVNIHYCPQSPFRRHLRKSHTLSTQLFRLWSSGSSFCP